MMHRCLKRWKDDFLSRVAIMFFFVGGPAFATAGPTWVEHSDVAQGLIAILFLIVGALLIRVLNKVDKNQDNLFDRLRLAEADIKAVKAVCEERKCHE